MNYDETMTAEMRPDVYSGPECDQHKPLWWCECEGNPGEPQNNISFNPATFPPGTKILVMEPCCPICNEIPTCWDDVENPKWKCNFDCDFDWHKWTEEEYS